MITMNRKQIIVLIIGISVIVLMGIYPPWIHRHRGTVEGYAFITNPPKTYSTIDLKRLGVQCGLVALVAGGFLVILKDKKKD